MGTCLLCDLLGEERGRGVRVVAQNDAFMAFVPFAPRFPFEVHVLSQRHAQSLLDLSDVEGDALAAMVHDLVTCYDRLYAFALPYVMSIHQAPTGPGDWQPVSHFHIEFTPFHRSAGRLKFLARSELGAGAFLNDVEPERWASELRAAIGTDAAHGRPSVGTDAGHRRPSV